MKKIKVKKTWVRLSDYQPPNNRDILLTDGHIFSVCFKSKQLGDRLIIKNSLI